MEKTVKVGKMPGRINEFVVAEGTSIKELLNLAELDAADCDVKIDGVKVTDLESTKVTANTSLVLLAAQVKGN